MEDLIKAIKEEREYDFIANNYLKYSKEELKNILLEFIYARYEDYSKDEIIENIKERYM